MYKLWKLHLLYMNFRDTGKVKSKWGTYFDNGNTSSSFPIMSPQIKINLYMHLARIIASFASVRNMKSIRCLTVLYLCWELLTVVSKDLYSAPCWPLRREKFNFQYTDPPPYFSQFVKKNQNEEKKWSLGPKFWKFCNSASCLHNILSQRTAASNTECKIINKRQKNWVNVW